MPCIGPTFSNWVSYTSLFQLRATSAKANTRATIGFTGAKGAVARTQAKKLLSSSPKNRASKSSGPSLRDRLVYMLAARPENEEKSGTSSEQISTILGMEKQSFDFLLPTIAGDIFCCSFFLCVGADYFLAFSS